MSKIVLLTFEIKMIILCHFTKVSRIVIVP